MHRFYYQGRIASAERISLIGQAQVHHIRDVLCLGPGEKVVVFDDEKNEYSCVISEVTDKIILSVLGKTRSAKKNVFEITVACAIPKKAKFDDIVDKLTQLGAERIIPMFTERVIVRWAKEKRLSQHKRWQKIALSAAEQSQRQSLPVIEPPKEIKEVLSQAGNFDLKLIPHLSGSRRTLKQIFAHSHFKNILVLIGPEGDFTPQEVSLAEDKGFIPITLGDTVLRVDTAAIAVASFFKLNEDH